MSDSPLSDAMKRFSAATTMIRGDLGYGRKAKPEKGALAQMAQFGPVDTHFYDDATGETTIKTVHYIKPILDQNRADRLSGRDGYSPSRELRHVARIPEGVVAQFYAQGINLLQEEGWEYVKALLDSNEYSELRTVEGKLGGKPIRTHFIQASSNSGETD